MIFCWVFFRPPQIKQIAPQLNKVFENLRSLSPCDLSQDQEVVPVAKEEVPLPPDPEVLNLLKCQPIKANSNKAENVCRSYLEKRFNVSFPTCRPQFLTNPKTGYRLELDCYNEELKLAVEYQGEQHYKWPNYLGRHKQSYREFMEVVNRDRFKVEMCEIFGIYLIRVPYTVTLKDIPDFIEERLPSHLK